MFWLRALVALAQAGRPRAGRRRTAAGPAKGIRYIEGEYEVVEADADADAPQLRQRDLTMAAPTLPSSMDRRRRRRLRLIPIIGYTIVALGLAYFFEQRPSTTVIFVRHADTDTAMAGRTTIRR